MYNISEVRKDNVLYCVFCGYRTSLLITTRGLEIGMSCVVVNTILDQKLHHIVPRFVERLNPFKISLS